MHVCMCFRLFSASKNALGLQNKGKKCFNRGMLNAHGKHPLKGSDPPAPRLKSWPQWGTIIIHSIEAIEAESGHAPALRSHPNQF